MNAKDFKLEGVTLTEATFEMQGETAPVNNCIIRGTMGERTGMDGQPYALRFELRLPDDWSGRFMHQFNGGNDGAVVPAFGTGVGTGLTPALARGFAVISSDAGHDGKARPDRGLAGGNAFGFDFEARKDYGYAAVAKLQPVALSLIKSYYGEAPKYVYGYGVSNGGRHGMVAVERMADQFDGILAGYPGFNLPKTALQSALDIQTFRSVGASLAESFSTEELGIAAAAILASCDALDGLEDGVVNDTIACQSAFDPKTVACRDGQNSACLPAEKVNALIKIHAGPKSASGEQLYNSTYWDPGMASGNWRFWKLESPIPPWNFKPLIATMGAGSAAQIFITPPVEVGGSPAELEDFMLNFDIETEAPKIYATSAAFPESPMQVMTPPNSENPTLAEFEAAGGKLIVFHGAADPVFSLKDTIDWYERLSANNPNVGDFSRLYNVPGMPHGKGGNSTDSFDLLDALIAWVEEDKAPDAVEAKFRQDNAEAGANAGATRPLCPYPGVARFAGGDQALAASFTCN